MPTDYLLLTNFLMSTEEKFLKSVEQIIPEKGRYMMGSFEKQKGEVFRRFPTLFILLTTLGVVSVFHGFENVVDRIPVFANNPLLLVLFGIVVLALTGTLYKNLQKD